MTRCNLKILFAFLFVCLGYFSGQAQIAVPFSRPIKEIRQEPIRYRMFPVLLPDGTYQVYFLVEIQYDIMAFVFQDSVYKANVEIEVAITNKKTGHAVIRDWRSSFSVNDYETTNRKDLYFLTIDSLQMAPGNYQFIIKYRDLNGDVRWRKKNTLQLRSHPKQYISPLLFLYPKRPSPQHFPFPYMPSAFREHWFFNRDVVLYFQWWTAASDTLHQLAVHVIPEKGQEIETRLDTVVSSSTTSHFFTLNLPTHLLEEGKYTIKRVLYFGSDSLVQNDPLRIVWFSKPRSLLNLTVAIQPLRYIMDEAEFESLRMAPLPIMKRRFRHFWKEKDPTPGTPFNEAMAVFYQRVDEANKRWSTHAEMGWETDIGRIFILYGKPDEVIDHSLIPEGEPTLVWIYYLPDKKVVVTFRALEGRKSYELLKKEEFPLEEKDG